MANLTHGLQISKTMFRLAHVLLYFFIHSFFALSYGGVPIWIHLDDSARGGIPFVACDRLWIILS